jgi:PAS domain S-box-containing protein
MSSVSEKFLLQIFEKSAPCLLMKADSPVFTIALVSDAYLQFTGLQRADMIGKSAFTIFPDRPDRPKGAITTLKAILECIATKKRVVIPAYAYYIAHPVTKQLEESWWSSTFDPILGDEGDVVYVLGTAADLTEQMKAGVISRAGRNS